MCVYIASVDIVPCHADQDGGGGTGTSTNIISGFSSSIYGGSFFHALVVLLMAKSSFTCVWRASPSDFIDNTDCFFNFHAHR